MKAVSVFPYNNASLIPLYIQGSLLSIPMSQEVLSFIAENMYVPLSEDSEMKLNEVEVKRQNVLCIIFPELKEFKKEDKKLEGEVHVMVGIAEDPEGKYSSVKKYVLNCSLDKDDEDNMSLTVPCFGQLSL